MPNKRSKLLAYRSLPRSVHLVADMRELYPKNIPALGGRQIIDFAPLDKKLICPWNFIAI